MAICGIMLAIRIAGALLTIQLDHLRGLRLVLRANGMVGVRW